MGGASSRICPSCWELTEGYHNYGVSHFGNFDVEDVQDVEEVTENLVIVGGITAI